MNEKFLEIFSSCVFMQFLTLGLIALMFSSTFLIRFMTDLIRIQTMARRLVTAESKRGAFFNPINIMILHMETKTKIITIHYYEGLFLSSLFALFF